MPEFAVFIGGIEGGILNNFNADVILICWR